MHICKPVKPVYAYPATCCNISEYLNDSVATKNFAHVNKTRLKLKWNMEITSPFPIARVAHLSSRLPCHGLHGSPSKELLFIAAGKRHLKGAKYFTLISSRIQWM
jgi:hypothetical protein